MLQTDRRTSYCMQWTDVTTILICIALCEPERQCVVETQLRLSIIFAM